MRIRGFLSATAMMAALSSPAFAQGAEDAPRILDGVRGLQSAGINDGIELFTVEGAQLIIGRAEGRNDIFVGMVFDEYGDDVGAAILGTEPVSFDDVLEAAGGSRDEPAASADVEYDEDRLERLMADMQGAKNPDELVKVLKAWQDEVRPSGDAGALESAPAEEGVAASDVTPNIAELLGPNGLTVMDVPAGPAEENAPAASGEEEPSSASLPELQDILRGIQDVQPVDPSVFPESTGDADLDAKLDDVMGQAEKALSFDEQAFMIYEGMSKDSFRFTVGDANAPTVYAFLDPACIYCSRAIEKIRPMVESGQIRIAAIPVPAISPSSPDAVARIVTASNPARALFDNARFVLSGGTDPLTDAKFDDLDPELKDHIRFNRQMMDNFGITQVPFFSFMTKDGPVTMRGLPADNAFSAAISEE